MNRVGYKASRFNGNTAIMLAAGLLCGTSIPSVAEVIEVRGGGISPGNNSSIRTGANTIELAVSPQPVPFCQSAIKQNAAAAKFGPGEGVPHFVVRAALPIPPDNATNVAGSLTGMDENVWAHNHSPGLEALPNGDVLAIFFSAKTSAGANESDNTTRFIQARLRHGAEQWDPPELFADFVGLNDQSCLLWTEGDTVRFFGGGRGASDWMPFKMAVSTNNGQTWSLSLPQLDKPAADYTAQPIANAFRGRDGTIYFAMDAENDHSFLWRSGDNGAHWNDTGGRTGARHSTIVPLDDRGNLLSIGGKNAGMNGWSPMNTSSDWGKTWSASQPSPFPALGGNQRPCLIRLANGHLLFVSDSYHRNAKKSPDGWKMGEGCFVAISKDNGVTWRFKMLPVTLPHEKDHAHGTLGYATVRQAPNGLIHLLTTMTTPCLHYEMNEAWIFSEAGDIAPESDGGKVQKFHEDYPDGSPRVTWSARVCPNGRYLLDGREASYFPNGRKEHEVAYANGRKVGNEIFWSPDGTKLWSRRHDSKPRTAVWTHYWPDGRKKVESFWTTLQYAPDSKRKFLGLVANGPARRWNSKGELIDEVLFSEGKLVSKSPKEGEQRVRN